MKKNEKKITVSIKEIIALFIVCIVIGAGIGINIGILDEKSRTKENIKRVCGVNLTSEELPFNNSKLLNLSTYNIFG